MIFMCNIVLIHSHWCYVCFSWRFWYCKASANECECAREWSHVGHMLLSHCENVCVCACVSAAFARKRYKIASVTAKITNAHTYTSIWMHYTKHSSHQQLYILRKPVPKDKNKRKKCLLLLICFSCLHFQSNCILFNIESSHRFQSMQQHQPP